MTRKRFIKLLRAEYARIGGLLAAMASHPTVHIAQQNPGPSPEEKEKCLQLLRTCPDGSGRPDYWEWRRRKETNQ